jgi:hypothetical protein
LGLRIKGKKVTAQAPWVSLEMTFPAILRTSAATGNSREFSFELNASVGIPEGDRPNLLGQFNGFPTTIKKEQPQRCGSSMLCVLTADETKAVSKRSGREYVLDIIY